MMVMKKKQAKLTDQLRAAVLADGRSQRQICLQADVAPPVLCRFMRGRGGLSMDGLDRLTEVLGWELVPRRRPSGERRTKKGR